MTWLCLTGCHAGAPPILPDGFVSDLPVIAIESDGVIADEPKTRARMRVYQGDLVHDGYVGVELRGRSSLLNFPKKQLGLELLTEGGVQTEGPLLGMPPESDWVLHGPYADKTLLRNALTFELARRTGRYAPRSVHVEVFLRDGPSRPADEAYQGVYLLSEKISRGRERIDLPSPRGRPGDATGFILKLDWEDPDVDEVWFLSPSGLRVIIVYPRADVLSDEQREYVESYIERFENALGSDELESLADLGSFVDAMIIQEIANNVDAYRSSTFLYKAPGGKLHLGPLWDFNQAYGNASYNTAASRSEGFRADRVERRHWMRQLKNDEAFFSRFAARFRELRAGPLADASIEAWIDAEASRLAGAADRNFERWPTLGTVVLGNPDPPAASYAEEIARLKTWLRARGAWLDRALGSPKSE